jgi:hypothetical protein
MLKLPLQLLGLVAALVNACWMWQVMTSQKARFARVAAIYKSQRRLDRRTILENSVVP